MYKVVLKIDKVSLRIKENVDIYIQIRKNKKHFSHSKKQALVNGEIVLANSSQFFINSTTPSFVIQIFLARESLKKKGGVVQICLSDYEINVSHRIIAPIQQIPLQNCNLCIDFMYMESEKYYQGQEMMSQQEIQNIDHKLYLQLILKQNQQLIKEKNRLNGEIKSLKQKNQQLENENSLMNNESEMKNRERSAEITEMEAEHDSILQSLGKQKQKIAQIVDIINEEGNYQLIRKAQAIINHQNQSFQR